ncbi:MAG: hypothetical protein JHC26_09410 [Thermofilum sp.]|uniref:hypothetical protein n=1 Tax=Thermofilum sp. TaxID=1961369 RepID=UPI00258FDFDE|nr:hypothetical protein [Thermofilum sp.]MCI4409298.1 hypothetical protein [Thermofilum sp.]
MNKNPVYQFDITEMRVHNGCEFYTLDEAETTNFETYDIYKHEFVLIFLALSPEIPIDFKKIGKVLYVFHRGLKEMGYSVQDICLNYIYVTLSNLTYSGYIDIIDSNVVLTEKGRAEASEMLRKKIRYRDVNSLTELKRRVLSQVLSK